MYNEDNDYSTLAVDDFVADYITIQDDIDEATERASAIFDQVRDLDNSIRKLEPVYNEELKSHVKNVLGDDDLNRLRHNLLRYAMQWIKGLEI